MTTTVRTLRAVLFDVDGTLAETERDGHRVAFNKAFRDTGLAYQWTVAEYGLLLRTTGGRRRIEQYLVQHGHHADEAATLAGQVHKLKTEYFADWVRAGYVQARPGAHALIEQLLALDIAVAIVTTGSSAWVRPLLERLFGGIEFATIVTGDDVSELKPDPEAYLLALERLSVSGADALVVEDSVAGLTAARAAQVACVVVTSAYTRADEFADAAAVVRGYLAMDMFDSATRAPLADGVTGEALVRLHARCR